MKILFLCHNLTGGGAERVCADVAGGLSVRGHEVMILTDTSAPVTYQPREGVRLINTEKGAGRLGRRWKSFRQLLGLLKRERPDAVVSILYDDAMLCKVASLLTCCCPVIASDHNSFERPAYAPMARRTRTNKFWLNYLLDGLTVLTDADREVLGGRFRHLWVMPNPLGIAPLPSVPPKQKTVLAVGRLNEWHYKGFDLLIGAWRSIGSEYADWTLRIVGHGDGEAKSYLESLARGIPNLEFRPYTRNIQAEYQKAEVFVLSSRYEGFGLVLTEAMSQGCACLACDYKGRQADIVTDGEDGLLCTVDDERMLARKLSLLLDDGQLRRKLQGNAIRSVERFGTDRIAQRWEEMLEERVWEGKKGRK